MQRLDHFTGHAPTWRRRDPEFAGCPANSLGVVVVVVLLVRAWVPAPPHALHWFQAPQHRPLNQQHAQTRSLVAWRATTARKISC